MDAGDRITDTVLNYTPPARAEKQPKKPHHPPLPRSDNTSAGLAALQAANLNHRKEVWPTPYNATEHVLHLGDARGVGSERSPGGLLRRGLPQGGRRA
jgi:hypothetical protein